MKSSQQQSRVWLKCFHYINYNSKAKSFTSLCPVSWLVCLFWELRGAVVEMPCYQKRQSRERAENLLYGSSVRALKCLCWRQMTWQHAACLTLCNLQDYPWFRANSERFRIQKRSKLRPFSLDCGCPCCLFFSKWTSMFNMLCKALYT